MSISTILPICLLACSIANGMSTQGTAALNKSEAQQTVLAREESLWHSFLGPRVDTKTLGAFLAQDFLGVDESGRFLSKEQTIQMLVPCTFFNYQISDPHIRILSETSYISAYEIEFEFSCSGQPTRHGGSLLSHAWKWVDSRWVLEVHAEANLPKKMRNADAAR